MDLPLIIALFTFIAITLATSAAFLYMNSREALQTWRRRADGTPSGAEATSDRVSEQLIQQFQALLEWLARLNQPSNVEEARATRRQLITAGYRSGKAPVFFIGAKLLVAVLMAALIALVPVKLLGFPTFTILVFYYVLAAACGYYAPVIWLKRSIAARKDALNRAIPDALDLMVVCVEAGLGLEASFVRVATEVRESHARIAEEFGMLSDELRAGRTRAESLRNLGERTDVPALRSFAALLIQTDALGTSIAQTLRTYSQEMREHRFLAAEEKAMRIPVLMTIPLVACILPVVVAGLLLPPAIDMVRDLVPALQGR